MIRVYVSNATDRRPVEALMARYDLSCTIEPLPMGDETQRKRFSELKARHDWNHLPMVFVNDEFIGGEPELRDYLAAHAEDPAARLATLLGVGGLIPFVALGLAVLLEMDFGAQAPLQWLCAYAATILSFIGAVHWGMAVAGPRNDGRYLLFAASVLPALVAWLALALPMPAGLYLLIAGFAGWYAWERVSAWVLYPRWFRRLRSLLTGVVCAVLVLVALAG